MSIGMKIKDLRISKGLTQEELADRCELSKGFISQLERDLTSPSIATLTDILQILGQSLGDFFQDDEPEQLVFGTDDYFEKTDEKLGNRIEWLIPSAQKNMMEAIRLTLEPGGKTYPDVPHEGEEFGFVLEGKITIHFDHHHYTAGRGDSFYLRPDKSHFIENHGKKKAVILWISTPPSF